VSAPIRFLFDFISPYAYLAWTQIHALAERHGRVVEPVPILFAALLDAHGHKGPAEIPPKRIYIFKDVVRTAHVLGVPLAPPPTHPFNPLLALRAASLPLGDAGRRALIDELFRAAWGGGAGVDDPGKVARAATTAGLDGDAIVEAAQGPEAKARLRAQTDAALAAGAFGVPAIEVEGESFWGLDSFPHVERHLRGEDPVTPESLARWAHVAPSATRRQGPRH
jgi:2-hydroxychromene-2-carboxylate isomerase